MTTRPTIPPRHLPDLPAPRLTPLGAALVALVVALPVGGLLALVF